MISNVFQLSIILTAFQTCSASPSPVGANSSYLERFGSLTIDHKPRGQQQMEVYRFPSDPGIIASPDQQLLSDLDENVPECSLSESILKNAVNKPIEVTPALANRSVYGLQLIHPKQKTCPSQEIKAILLYPQTSGDIGFLAGVDDLPDQIPSLTKLDYAKTLKRNASLLDSTTINKPNFIVETGNLSSCIIFIPEQKDRTIILKKNETIVDSQEGKCEWSTRISKLNEGAPALTLLKYEYRNVLNSELPEFSKNDYMESMSESLKNLVETIIATEMTSCELIIAIDRIYKKSKILEVLLDIPVLKQVVEVASPEDLAHRIKWNSINCQGIFLLLSRPEPLLDFGNNYKFQWDYKAKVVIVGQTKQSLELFTETVKGKKTQHIIGVVPDQNNQRLQIFMNLLFWGKGVQQISNWLGHRFTKEVDLFPNKVNNLRKGLIKVIMFNWPPVMFTITDSTGTVIERHGRDVYVVENLSQVLNFTLSFIDIDLDWGVLLPNGSFTGMVGHLGRDIGHIGIANIYATAVDDRHKFQDYSTPVFEDRSCFLARVDPPLPRWRNPSLPFQPQTWLALFISFLLTGPILYLLAMTSNRSGDENPQFTSFADSCLAAVAIHFEHPLETLPRALGTQMFTVFLLLYSIIITTGYRGNLIAFLTVTREPKGFETIEELYESGLPIQGIPYFASEFKLSGNPYLRGLLDRYQIRSSFDELKDEVLVGKSVTVNSRISLEALIAPVKTKKGKPLLRFLKECLNSYSVGLGYAMHFPLKSRIDGILARMFESGIVVKWFQRTNEFYWKLIKEGETKDYEGGEWYTSTDGVIPLGMDHMQGIFIVYAAGFVVSKIIFIAEILNHKFFSG